MQRNGCETLSTADISPEATLTSDQSLTCDPKICADTVSVTSLPGSADGPMRSDLPDGPTTDLFGQEVVPVSRSQQRANVPNFRINATSGPHGSSSSASARLQSSLESRLRERPFGSTECSMTWRVKTTPWRRRFCQLVPLMPHIGGIASGLWPTPVSKDDNKSPEAHMAMKKRMKGGPRNNITSLQVLTKSLWPTPKASAAGETSRSGKRKGELLMGGLARQFASQLWPTPTAMTDTGGAALCKWGGTRSREKLRQAVTPQELNGALNPAFPCWLMGYPQGWLNCAPLAMPSSLKSRRNLSSPQAPLENNRTGRAQPQMVIVPMRILK
jgi:hypothetical protein